MDISVAHVAALRELVAAMPPEEHKWAVTGSAGLRLQGVPVDVHDLDVQTGRAAAEFLVERIADRVRTQLHHRRSKAVRAWFAVLDLAGVTVEVMAEISKRLPNGSWERPIDVAAVRSWVEVAGLRVPVVDLAHEANAYEILGRAEKVALIRRVLAGPRSS